jgi:signal transduction histidine kinase
MNALHMDLKILFLEDREDDCGLVKRTLEKAGFQFELMSVDTRAEFEEALAFFQADVILSDHALPQFNSSEALAMCRSRGIDVPFILVTGTVSEEFAANCIKLGADDYILKSNLTRLPAAISNALKKKEAEKAEAKAMKALQYKNDELVTANNELNKINNELDSFVYSVSHNLRAPLMSVLGLLGLSKREIELHNFDAVTPLHGMMEKSILKLDETLKEILDYSRNARKDVVLECIDIKNLINESIDKLKFIAGTQNLKITINVSEDSFLSSDRYRLSVILNNLLSNAIKYRDKNKSVQYINISVAKNKEAALITVTDNGIGIGKIQCKKIFDMFYRGTEQSDGAGLGLYIVKEALEKLKGTIDVESTVGEGSAFRVMIPYEQVA